MYALSRSRFPGFLPAAPTFTPGPLGSPRLALPLRHFPIGPESLQIFGLMVMRSDLDQPLGVDGHHVAHKFLAYTLTISLSHTHSLAGKLKES